MHPVQDKILELKRKNNISARLEEPYTYNDLNNACERLKSGTKTPNLPGTLIDYLLKISKEFYIISEPRVFNLESLPTVEQQLLINIPLDVSALVMDDNLAKIFVELDTDSYIYMGSGDHFGSIWVSAIDDEHKKCVVKFQENLMDYIELLFTIPDESS